MPHAGIQRLILVTEEEENMELKQYLYDCHIADVKDMYTYMFAQALTENDTEKAGKALITIGGFVFKQVKEQVWAIQMTCYYSCQASVAAGSEDFLPLEAGCTPLSCEQPVSVPLHASTHAKVLMEAC
eukprot:2013278-Karenia_brevis.AAC.1